MAVYFFNADSLEDTEKKFLEAVKKVTNLNIDEDDFSQTSNFQYGFRYDYKRSQGVIVTMCAFGFVVPDQFIQVLRELKALQYV
jgi:hypothetical protein